MTTLIQKPTNTPTPSPTPRKQPAESASKLPGKAPPPPEKQKEQAKPTKPEVSQPTKPVSPPTELADQEKLLRTLTQLENLKHLTPEKHAELLKELKDPATRKDTAQDIRQWARDARDEIRAMATFLTMEKQLPSLFSKEEIKKAGNKLNSLKQGISYGAFAREIIRGIQVAQQINTVQDSLSEKLITTPEAQDFYRHLLMGTASKEEKARVAELDQVITARATIRTTKKLPNLTIDQVRAMQSLKMPSTAQEATNAARVYRPILDAHSGQSAQKTK
jgi:hypothetical protein